MSKAFPCIRHDVLLRKLASDGFNPHFCRWFHSYLCDRRNSVRVNGIFSEQFILTFGVPKGSSLGPLLFQLLVNDIAYGVNNNKILLFAKDVKLFLNMKSLSNFSLLQADLHRTSRWCIESSLLLNLFKFKSMVLSRKCDFFLWYITSMAY